MRTRNAWWAFLGATSLAACSTGTVTVPGTTKTETTTEDTGAPDTDADTDTDVDADTDVDTDTDSDVDTDTDTDTDVPQTGDTGGPPADPPDWVVDCNGGGDFTTIQDAIVAATSGQSIAVEPCVYDERIDFLGKAVDVYGVDGSSATVIDGGNGGTVVNIESGEPDGARLAGFTITGGEDDDDGAAIELYYSSAAFEDLVVEGNDGLAMIYAVASLVDLDTVVIAGNTVASDGQAIFSDGGGLTARGLDIDCDGGAEAIYHHNVLVLADSTVTCRSGSYGIHDYHGEDRIQRSTVSGGEAGIYAYDVESTPDEPDTPDERFQLWNSVVSGGRFGVDVRYMDVEIGNAVLTGADAALSATELAFGSSASASAFVGAACGVSVTGPLSVTHGAFWDNTDDACGANVNPVVTADPLFVAFPSDVHLQAGSPLIDAGPAGADRADADGSRNDIGAYGGPMPHP